MISETKQDAQERMKKSVEALHHEFTKIRTGRAHPSLLDHIKVDYYGSEMPLNQVASVSVSDSRTLTVTPWEKTMVSAVEKAILNSGLGLNPVTAGEVIRVPMPALNEERRKELIKVVRTEAESARVSIRNVRRDANGLVKNMLKDKSITEDEERRLNDDVQKLTDKFIVEVDQLLTAKETDLMAI